MPVGLLMFVSACLVGTTVAGMTLREVVAGFPVNILRWDRHRRGSRRAGGHAHRATGTCGPVLMAIAINGGISAGSYAPTSLFGVITYQVAHQAGIDVDTFVLLAVATAANVALLAGAMLVFRSARRQWSRTRQPN